MKNSIDTAYSDLTERLTDYLTTCGKLAVIKAPPGSGKTHMLIEVLSELVTAGQRVAVATQTNNQADDLCVRAAERYPALGVVRFASAGHPTPSGLPQTVRWATTSAELPHSPSITVATSAKWSLTDIAAPFDLLAVDEAWQMSWADFMQCAQVSARFLLIGDPGQIPPVVPIDVRRWETSPRAPHLATPDVILDDPSLESLRFVGGLPACRRLPNESVEFIKPFYDFDFAAYVDAGTRGVDLPKGHRLGRIDDGKPIVVTVPTPEFGPPADVDEELASVVADLVEDLLTSGAKVRSANSSAEVVTSAHIGVTSSRRLMNNALTQALSRWGNDIRVDTPERWQGLEKAIMIAVHPLSGVAAPSSFDLETGRLCVMASRHQAALIIVCRDHVPGTLLDYVPSAEQAPGRPDSVGRGHDAHLRFWDQLADQQRVIVLKSPVADI